MLPVPTGSISLLAFGMGAMGVRRLFPDRALRRFAEQRWTFWRGAEEVFWGRLEPRGPGFSLEFDQPYEPSGEPRRSAAIFDTAAALDSIALARPHSDGELFAELVRNELVRRSRGARSTRDTWSEVSSGARALLDGADQLVDRFVAPRAPRVLQDGWLLERWRGRNVVVELKGGVRLAGRLVEIGRSWLALVTTANARRERRVDDLQPSDGPLTLTREEGNVVLSAAEQAVHVECLASTTRRLALDVTLLPHTRLVMPWPAADAVVTAHSGVGLDLLVPRATARVLFAAESDAAAATTERT